MVMAIKMVDAGAAGHYPPAISFERILPAEGGTWPGVCVCVLLCTLSLTGSLPEIVYGPGL